MIYMYLECNKSLLKLSQNLENVSVEGHTIGFDFVKMNENFTNSS
jgi:hypothetical protein